MYQTLFMGCVGCKVGSNTDLTHEVASVIMKTEGVRKSYLFITTPGDIQNEETEENGQEERQRDGRWKKENVSALIPLIPLEPAPSCL